MVNKKNLWFLTLFSLVLVLSIYYVTLPNEAFTSNLTEVINEDMNEESVNIEESSVISVLKVEDDASVMKEINSLKEKLTNTEISVDDKNKAFEELKLINKNSSKEETIESSVKELCKCENFVKIDGNNVRVVLDSEDKSASTANKIMRTVQEKFDEKMYISVKFN